MHLLRWGSLWRSRRRRKIISLNVDPNLRCLADIQVVVWNRQRFGVQRLNCLLETCTEESLVHRILFEADELNHGNRVSIGKKIGKFQGLTLKGLQCLEVRQ